MGTGRGTWFGPRIGRISEQVRGWKWDAWRFLWLGGDTGIQLSPERIDTSTRGPAPDGVA